MASKESMMSQIPTNTGIKSMLLFQITHLINLIFANLQVISINYTAKMKKLLTIYQHYSPHFTLAMI